MNSMGIHIAQDQFIAKETLDQLRSRSGPLQRLEDTFNELASKEAIRKFADGIGDVNPLWRNEEYARKSRFGRIVAPPSWLLSVFPGWISIEMPGIQATPAGMDIEYYKPVFIGDKISVLHRYADLDVKRNGKLAIENHEEVYYNQNGEMIAKARSWCILTGSIPQRVGRSQHGDMPESWSIDDLANIEKEIANEKMHNVNVRYWEDTQIGEELPAVVKGPVGLTDMVAYLIGAAPLRLTAHEATIDYLRTHPLFASRDPITFSLERAGAIHYNLAMGKEQGMKSGFIFGGQGQCWVTHMLTNWMGDDGWLKRNYVEYRGFVNFSDLIRIKGTIRKKYIDENKEYCVDVETNGINQKGTNILPGHSTIILPYRDNDSWPLNQRVKERDP